MRARIPSDGRALEGVTAERLARLIEEGEPWLGADPALAEFGAWMIHARHAVELRQLGCAWLAMFPSVESVRALAGAALAPATPPPVREQAIRALGSRQLRGRHPSTLWSAEAVQLADEALIQLAVAATAEGRIASDRLPAALRHVQADALAAVFARAPALWADAIECFATPPLARVLVVSIDDIAPPHRLRVLRLIVAALGDEAVPLLLARANAAAPEERLEMLFLAITCGGERHLPRLEDALAGLPGGAKHLLRERARWHLANPGVVPTVRGLRVARTTGLIRPAERAARCAAAADDLRALTQFARHAEPYVYTLWAWLVRAAEDPARARELAAAHGPSQALIAELYLEELARRGRVAQLVATARALDAADTGALALAIWGRPLAALELAAGARRHTPELVCARALACYRAGRPDLMDRMLVEDLPPAELVSDAAAEFPGPHERWLIAEQSGAGGAMRPGDSRVIAFGVRSALAALAGGKASVIALARPAPLDAEPDATSLDPVAVLARRLARSLAGATVYLAGEWKRAQRDAIAAAVASAGGRLAGAPYATTDYFVVGEACPAATIAQLERAGARRLRRGELEGI